MKDLFVVKNVVKKFTMEMKCARKELNVVQNEFMS